MFFLAAKLGQYYQIQLTFLTKNLTFLTKIGKISFILSENAKKYAIIRITRTTGNLRWQKFLFEALSR